MYVSIVVIVIAYFLSVLTSYRGYVLQMTFNENKHIEVQNIQRNNLISIRVLFCFFFSFFSHFWFGMVWFYGVFLRILRFPPPIKLTATI
jgi:hypothetical protein